MIIIIFEYENFLTGQFCFLAQGANADAHAGERQQWTCNIIQMVHKRKKYTANRLRGLRSTKNLPTPKSPPPKKKTKSASTTTRLSPCMASAAGNLTLGGLTGKRNRHSMRPELERFVRRTRQRERMVTAIREITDRNQSTMEMASGIFV